VPCLSSYRTNTFQYLLLLPAPRRLCNNRCLSVCLSVSMSVCLLATLRKSADRIFILPEMYLWTKKKKWLNFESRPDLEIFEGFVNIASYRALFPQFGSHLWKSWSDFHENIIINVSSDNEVTTTFWKSSGSGSQSGRDSHWRTSALSECFYFSAYVLLSK